VAKDEQDIVAHHAENRLHLAIGTGTEWTLEVTVLDQGHGRIGPTQDVIVFAD
jgi:hypothetical protein